MVGGKYTVEKTSNPPNVPQARSIEKLWVISVQKVFEREWHAGQNTAGVD